MQTFNYNSAGQIASVARSNDAYAWAAHYNVDRSYTIDGLRRRRACRLFAVVHPSRCFCTGASGAMASARERRYVYDAGHRIVGEYGATTADLRAEYIWLQPEVGAASPFGGGDGLGGYMPLAVAVPDGVASKIQWVQGNHLGTPVATTDASGAPVTPTGYARIGFPGQVEQHADLYYNYYRDYDPTLGRYVQADPIGLDGDVNPYVYAGANLLASIDPMGLRGIWKGHPTFGSRPRPGGGGIGTDGGGLNEFVHDWKQLCQLNGITYPGNVLVYPDVVMDPRNLARLMALGWVIIGGSHDGPIIVYHPATGLGVRLMPGPQGGRIGIKPGTIIGTGAFDVAAFPETVHYR